MTGLQEAFYIVGIVYMGISLLIIIGILVAIGVIRSKIVSIERTIKEKLQMANLVGEKAGEVLTTVKKLAGRKK